MTNMQTYTGVKFLSTCKWYTQKFRFESLRDSNFPKGTYAVCKRKSVRGFP